MKQTNRSRILLLMVLGFTVLWKYAAAQELTIDYCLQKAKEHSPLTQQKLYYETLETLTHQNLNSAFLPQLNLNAQTTYQSDVFTFLAPIPGFEPRIPKDQYKVSVDITQNIYDGGMAKNRKLAESAKLASEKQAVNVEIHQVLANINQLFFSALISQANLNILQNLHSVLLEQEKTTESGVTNGLLLGSALDDFRKQILNTEQEMLGVELSRDAMLKMLGKWIGEEVDDGTRLHQPETVFSDLKSGINRPEIDLFENQKQYFEALKNLSTVQRRPSFMAFAQGGFGYPNPFNWFDTNLSGFYMVGLRMNWNILDYGNNKRNAQIYSSRQAVVDTQLKNFEEHTERQLINLQAEIDKIIQLLQKDEALMVLQERIVSQAYSQMNNGTITSTEYLTKLNDKTQLELKFRIHQLQLEQAKVNYLIITGNI